VLEGSVRKAGNRARVIAQLIDARSGIHLWAERYDRLLGDIFDVQDEIAMSVVGAIEPNVRKAEIERVKRKRPESLEAYDLVLQASPFVYSMMAERAAPAIPLLERALELEPDYATAHALLAWCYHFRFSRAGNREEDRAASNLHARAALAGGTDDATTLAIAGIVIWFDQHPGFSVPHLFLVASLVGLGRTNEAGEEARRVLDLDPTFTIRRFSVTVGLVPAVFERFAEAWLAAGLPME
jgi:tetratricopeptide (TPR) repeat protein